MMMTESRTIGLETRGRYFEEFAVGDRVISHGRTVTEADIVAFAAFTGDYNPLHCDAEYARGTVFGERIAHGLLGLAIATGLIERLGFIAGTVQAFLGLEWKFRGPIKIGDTIHVEAEVARTKEMRRMGGGIVILNVAVVNQSGEAVQNGQWTALIKSRPQP